MEKELTFNQKTENMVQRVYDICDKTKTSGTAPQIKQKQIQVKRKSKSSKLKETARSSKFSLPEKVVH